MKKVSFYLFFILLVSSVMPLRAQWNHWCYKNFEGTYDNTVNATFTIPAGCDQVIIEAIGAGGGGGAAGPGGYAGGGGGGAYARCNAFAVSPGQTLAISIGPSGYARANEHANRGGSSEVKYNGTTKVKAVGGTTVSGSDGTGYNVNNGAYGGAASECIGNVRYSGGNGVPGKGGLDSYVLGGAGGGAASGGGNGYNATFYNGLQTDGAGTGGNGGPTVSNGLTNASKSTWLSGRRGADARDSKNGWGANDCPNAGGGGSGARSQILGSIRSGGHGGPGLVRIWFHIRRDFTVSSAPFETTICYGTSQTLTGSHSNTLGTVSYKWGNGATTTTRTVAPTVYTTYTLSVTDNLQSNGVSDGACAVTKTANSVIYVRPQFTAGQIASGHKLYVIDVTETTPITIGNTTSAHGGDNAIQYDWYCNGVSIGNNSATLTIDPTTYAVGNYTFTRKAKDNTCVGYTQSSGSYVLEVKSVGANASGTWDQWCYKDYTSAGNHTFTIPAGCDRFVAEAIGGGGGGSNATSIGAYGGGGGGAYARKEFVVSNSANQIAIVVGTGARRKVGGDENDASNSTVAYNGFTLTANCGGSLGNNKKDGAAGGAATTGDGVTSYKGGNGANRHSSGILQYPGGGGGAAGCNGAGGNASNGTGGAAGAGGTFTTQTGAVLTGLSGAKGGNAGTSGGNENGHGGDPYGSGASGAACDAFVNRNAGDGQSGIVRIWFHMNVTPTLSVTPNIAEVCAGSSITLTASEDVTTTGWTKSYSWSPSATGASATFTPTVTDQYKVTATYSIAGTGNTCSYTVGPASSILVTNVFDPGSIASTGETISPTEAASTISGTPATGGQGSIRYQWCCNGADIEGAVDETFTPGATYTGHSGTYVFTRKAFNDCNPGGDESTGSWTLVVRQIVVSFAGNAGIRENWWAASLPTTYSVDYGSPYGNHLNSGTIGTGYYIRTGFAFRGWKLNADGTGDLITPASTVAVSENHTLYGYWEPLQTTVTFNTNSNGEVPLPAGMVGSKPISFGKTYSTADPNMSDWVLTRDGYVFMGWNLSPDGTGLSVGPQAHCGLTSKDPDALTPHTLYAQWKPISEVEIETEIASCPVGTVTLEGKPGYSQYK